MRVGALKDVTAVDEATAVANRYLEAIGEEIEGRRTHHKRFFQTKDEGHEKWLSGLGRKQTSVLTLLTRLRRRRDEVVAEAEAARRQEERIRAIQESQQKAAEAEAARRHEERLKLMREFQPKAEESRRILGERTNTSTISIGGQGPSRVPSESALPVPGYSPGVAVSRAPTYPPMRAQPRELGQSPKPALPPRASAYATFTSQSYSPAAPPPRHPSYSPAIAPPPRVPQAATGYVTRDPSSQPLQRSWTGDLEGQRRTATVRTTSYQSTYRTTGDEDAADCGCFGWLLTVCRRLSAQQMYSSTN
ncbi:hypothetical protein BD309DRAFT_959636 [Dichomitus squalens]|nr:hypothetical protein BD309DRAFT_959636 [Dichomitus squalens]